ncbi:hypothetical protein [Acidiphilium sp.]|uniref:hypothetical protein n=1 Tax=Acidiphilium sp. TaxID=527 RepID=UPI00258364F9|nr:hypothetical protein [Acidiphilium sp.]
MHAALALRFAAIVHALCRAVAARGARGALAAPVVILLWLRLNRASKRIDSLAARLDAAGGALPAPKPDRRRNRPARRSKTLPRRFAWLLRPIPEATAAASQLRHLMADPACAALLEAEPRFGRILRPLCRHLGIRPPACIAPREPPPPPRRPKPAPDLAPESIPEIPTHAAPPAPRIRPRAQRPVRAPPRPA